jgi:uncharacterized protein (TIGR03435 family)
MGIDQALASRVRLVNLLRRNIQHSQVKKTATDALKTQLGLKLLKQKGPVNTFVIDQVEMPSEN